MRKIWDLARKKAWKYSQNCFFRISGGYFSALSFKIFKIVLKSSKNDLFVKKIRTLSRFFDESSFQFRESLGVDFTGEGFHFLYFLAFWCIVLFLDKLSGEFSDRQLLEAVLHGGFWINSLSKKGISSKKRSRREMISRRARVFLQQELVLESATCPAALIGPSVALRMMPLGAIHPRSKKRTYGTEWSHSDSHLQSTRGREQIAFRLNGDTPSLVELSTQ